MTMKVVRETHGVNAKRGASVLIREGPFKGRHGVIRRSKDGLLIVTDKPGRYGWMSYARPQDLEFLQPNTPVSCERSESARP
ncbi:hypothetical protein [Ideonella sp.]|uniref:hypothetical protein n=1 Tax=Ideonella sp. TaxID=1929293 RepID=UPI003BB7EA78